MADQARIVIEGIPELREGLRRIGGRPLERKLGQVHKRIGSIIIDAAGGAQSGVGKGRGARLRPSATTRNVVIRAGGSHRKLRVQQWGIRPVRPHPHRPFILEAAADNVGRIEAEYAEGVQAVIDEVFGG